MTKNHICPFDWWHIRVCSCVWPCCGWGANKHSCSTWLCSHLLVIQTLSLKTARVYTNRNSSKNRARWKPWGAVWFLLSKINVSQMRDFLYLIYYIFSIFTVILPLITLKGLQGNTNPSIYGGSNVRWQCKNALKANRNKPANETTQHPCLWGLPF